MWTSLRMWIVFVKNMNYTLHTFSICNTVSELCKMRDEVNHCTLVNKLYTCTLDLLALVDHSVHTIYVY